MGKNIKADNEWQRLCNECDEAIKSFSKTAGASENQGQQNGSPPISTGGNGIPLGAQDSDPSVELANVIVELEDGCVEHIQMNDSDTAEEVAKQVCQRHDLPQQFVALLAEHITDRYPKRSGDKKKEEEAVAESERSQESKDK